MNEGKPTVRDIGLEERVDDKIDRAELSKDS
jgi:hypothetical protein